MTIRYRAGKNFSQMAYRDFRIREVNKKSISTSEKIRLLKRETSNDAVLCNLREVIVEGWPDKRDNTPKPMRRYWCYRDELSVEDGLIMKGERVVIFQIVQSEVLERLHAGHQGIEKCKLRAKSCVYLDDIKKDLEEMVKRCPTCQELRKSNAKETLKPQEAPTRANTGHRSLSLQRQ